MRPQIVIDEGSMMISAGRRATAQIYIKLGALNFPEKGWSEDVVSLLDSWVCTMNDFLLGDERTMELHFLEGDFSVVVDRDFCGDCVLTCIDSAGDQEIFHDSASLSNIASELFSAGMRICELLGRMGGMVYGLNSLRQHLNQLNECMGSDGAKG